MKKTVIAIISAAFLALTVADSQGMFAATAAAVHSCLTVIIPSLFAGMVISSYLMHSGAYRVLLPFASEEFAIFIMSLVCGYPTGAKMLSESDMPSERKAVLLPCCYCVSPMFAVTVTGGLIVYVSCVLSCIIMYVFTRLKYGGVDEVSQPPKPQKHGSFIFAVQSSRSLFTVCAFICAFTLMSESVRFIASELFQLELPAVIYAIIEVSRIADAGLSLPMSAALTSLGGLCILGQAAAIAKDINLRKFLLSRVPLALTAGIVCKIFTIFVNFYPRGETEVFSRMFVPNNAAGAVYFTFSASQSYIAAFSLFIMTLLFICEFSQKSK